MENATKALIIAGSVLIALMIIGALLLMFNSLSSYQETNVQGTREAQVIEFNNQYETYNRDDVRGSDLYSLLNRVIDYNRRKSTEGTGSRDEGQYLAYEPMKIQFTIKTEDINQLSADGTKRLIKSQTYTISSTENTFENQVKGKVDKLEDEYGSDTITNLATNITNIFPENPTDEQKKNAIIKFNLISKHKDIEENWNRLDSKWKELQAMKDDIYTYYEYVQFKRAYFDCTRTEYNKNTGRITEMYFESNGKFN